MKVLIVDARGGILDDQFVPLQHRIQFDGTQIHGTENLHRQFSSAEWSMFINLVRMMPSGTYSSFSWQRET